MTANRLAVGGFDHPRLSRQIALQKILEAPFPNEADPGTVPLARVVESRLRGDAAHLGFFQIADREQRPGELGLAQRVNEIGLILAAVHSLEQPEAPFPGFDAGVVTRGDQLGAQPQRIIQKGLELDFLVTEYVGIGRPSRRVFGQKDLKHMVPVFGREIDGLQRNTQAVTDGLRVGQIFLGRAIFGAVILIPVFHEQASHRIALFQQAQRSDRGIDAAGHADDHFDCHRIRVAGI